MKKLLSILMILCFCLITLVGCSSSNSGINNKYDAMELIDNSSQYYVNAKNFKLDHEMKSCLIYNSVNTGEPIIITTCTNVETMVYNSPFCFSNEIILTFDEDTDDGTLGLLLQRTSSSQQYGVADGDNVTIYQSVDREWNNAQMTNEDFLKNDTLGVNYILNYKTYITEGTIVNSNEKLDGTDTIKAEYSLNNNYLKILFLKSGFEPFASMINESNPDKAIEDLMKGVKLTVWFDKNSSAVLQTQIDMTQLMDTIVNLILDDNKDTITAEQSAFITNYANEVELINTVKYGSINNDSEFNLPDDAKN